MTWTLPWAILFMLGLLLLLGYFLSKKVFPAEEETDSSPQYPRGPDCKSCGEAGCGGFAKGLVRGGQEQTTRGMGENNTTGEVCSLKKTSPETIRFTAVVRCQGVHVPSRYQYAGGQSCLAAAGMDYRPKNCQDACLGFCDCLTACPPRAIRVHQGIAYIDPARCTGCGDCVS